VPLLVRYSPQNDAPVFVAGLFVVTALAGLAFWARLFARAEHPEDAVRVRRRLWRLFAWAFAAVAAVLGLLAAVTWGGSGHPPAIVYVMAMGVLAAIGFGLGACFLLSSYVGQAFSRSRITR
jgi:MFS family permease